MCARPDVGLGRPSALDGTEDTRLIRPVGCGTTRRYNTQCRSVLARAPRLVGEGKSSICRTLTEERGQEYNQSNTDAISEGVYLYHVVVRKRKKK